MATCKKFFEFCYDRGVSLPNRNFTVKYDTNIPRQVSILPSSVAAGDDVHTPDFLRVSSGWPRRIISHCVSVG